MIHDESMRLKLFKIIGEQTYQLDNFANIDYFEITSVTFLTNHLYKLILKRDLEEMIQYTNGETINSFHFRRIHSNISITSNCNGILEITYEKIEYKGNPMYGAYCKFMEKHKLKYYGALFKKKSIKGNVFAYIDRKTIANLKLHYSDIEFIHDYDEVMQTGNKYINISKQTPIDVYGDVLLGIEINAVEQTVCNISLRGDIFLSFNVKQGRHNYDIFTLDKHIFWGMHIWFENKHVNIIKYKCLYLPHIFKYEIFTNYPIVLHHDMYTPNIAYKGYHNFPIEDISKAKNRGIRIALYSMILALNDNNSNLQMLNHDILFNILCQLKTLLF